MAEKHNRLMVGDVVDVSLSKGPYYRTQIEHVAEDGTLLAAVPIYKGIPIILRQGQPLMLFFYRYNGKFEVEAEVREIVLDGQIRLVRFALLTEPEKEQNREYYRVPISLKTTLYRVKELSADGSFDARDAVELETAYTKDISISGVLIKTKQEYQVGDKLVIGVQLNWYTGDSEVAYVPAEVKRVAHDVVNNYHFLGFRFLQDAEQEELISKYVLEMQKKLIKQQKLTIEG